MKHALFLFLTIIALNKISFPQRDFGQGFNFDTDYPFQYNLAIKNTSFREIDYYDSSDSLFNLVTKTCTKKEIYNDSGRLIKLVSGQDLQHNKINYEVFYNFVSDTICKITTEYHSNYIDSILQFKNSMFRYDTLVNKKYKSQEIFKREKNGNVIIHSVLSDFKKENDLPTKIFFFDKDYVLQGISYPHGNRTPTREWTDSTTENGNKAIFYHAIYPENEYYSYQKYSNAGLLLESGYSNYTPNSNPDIWREIYIYDRNGQLLYKYTLNAAGYLGNVEHYVYKGTVLSEYTMDYNPEDSIINLFKKYNDKGQLIVYSDKSTNDNYREQWTYNYIYINGLQVRTDYFKSQKYVGSQLFAYH